MRHFVILCVLAVFLSACSSPSVLDQKGDVEEPDLKVEVAEEPTEKEVVRVGPFLFPKIDGVAIREWDDPRSAIVETNQGNQFVIRMFPKDSDFAKGYLDIDRALESDLGASLKQPLRYRWLVARRNQREDGVSWFQVDKRYYNSGSKDGLRTSTSEWLSIYRMLYFKDGLVRLDGAFIKGDLDGDYPIVDLITEGISLAEPNTNR